jgi:hypothetical protein
MTEAAAVEEQWTDILVECDRSCRLPGARGISSSRARRDEDQEGGERTCETLW